MYHIRKSEWLLRFTGRPGSTAKPRNNDSGMARCSNSTGDRGAIAQRQIDQPSRPLGSPGGGEWPGWTPTGRSAAGLRILHTDGGASSWPGNRIKLPGRRNPGEGYPWYKPPPKSLGIGLLVSSRGICRRRALIEWPAAASVRRPASYKRGADAAKTKAGQRAIEVHDGKHRGVEEEELQ